MLLQEHLVHAIGTHRRRVAADRRASATVSAEARKVHAVELERVRASVLRLPDLSADDQRGA